MIRILSELKAYTSFYFLSEENTMIDNAYPNFTAHKKEHEELLDTLHAKLTEIVTSKENPMSMIPFLMDWFLLHTTKRDVKLAQYLASLT